MNANRVLKITALAAVAGALLVPTASFAGSPFVFGGPGYQAPVHTNAATSEEGYRAFAYEPGPRRNAGYRTERACMQPQGSLLYEPCFNHG